MGNCQLLYNIADVLGVGQHHLGKKWEWLTFGYRGLGWLTIQRDFDAWDILWTTGKEIHNLRHSCLAVIVDKEGLYSANISYINVHLVYLRGYGAWADHGCKIKGQEIVQLLINKILESPLYKEIYPKL